MSTFDCAICSQAIPTEVWDAHVGSHRAKGESSDQTVESYLWGTRYWFWTAMIIIGGIAAFALFR